MKLFTTSVKGYFTAILITIILTTLTPIAYLIINERERAMVVADHTLHNALTLQISYLSLWFRDNISEIEGISQLSSVQGRNYERMVEDFKAFTEGMNDLDSLVYINKAGIAVLSDKGLYIDKRISVEDREYFKAARRGRKFITSVIIGRDSGSPIIIFSVPVFKDNAFDGLVFGSVRLDMLAQLINSQNFGEGGEFRIFNEKGLSIEPDRNKPGSVIFSKKSYFDPNSITVNDHHMHLKDPHGQNNIILYISQLPYSNLFVGGSLDIREVMRSSIAVTKTSLLTLMLLLSVGITLFIMIFKKISEALQFVGRNITDLANGDYTLSTGVEIGHFPSEIKKIAIAIEELKNTTRAAIMKIRKQAITDSLTGLFNRFYFEQTIRKYLPGENDPITILICDVNGLKLINDALGHSWGDLLLKRASKVLTNIALSDSTVARIGGDEFAIIESNSNLNRPRELELSLEAEMIKVRDENPHIPVHMAWGICQGNARDRDLFELIKDADEKMYSLKEKQRKDSRKSILNFFVEKIKTEGKDRVKHMERCQSIMSAFMEEVPHLDDKFKKRMADLAAIHDIGMVGVSSNLLSKKGPLSLEERREIQAHPEIGYRIALNIPYLNVLAEPILYHHRWWNGGGYPVDKKLSTKDAIPLESRILALVDSYESMTGKTYGPQKSHQQAIDCIEKLLGTHFDPHWGHIFLEFLRKNEF